MQMVRHELGGARLINDRFNNCIFEGSLEEAALMVEVYRKTLELASTARADGHHDEAVSILEEAYDNRNKATDILSGVILPMIQRISHIEGLAIQRMSHDDQQYIALGAAFGIVCYWGRRPRPADGYRLSASFVKSHVRDFIRQAIIFGRADRRKETMSLETDLASLERGLTSI